MRALSWKMDGWRERRSVTCAVCHGARASRSRRRLCTRLDAGETPAPLKGRVLRSNARFAAFPRLLPLIPPAPFSHTGRRGRLGVLMPETEDGTQGLPQKPTPVRYPCPLLPHGEKGEVGRPDA
jgi:hypothetical protein